MRIACLRHVSFEGPGIIADWSNGRGCSMKVVQPYLGESLPRSEDLDAMLVMGGPMSAGDTKEYPWLRDEKALISNMLEAGKPTMGICLGAQLIADVLGARVYRNSYQEVGWYAVELTPQAEHDPIFAGFPDRMVTFHWHNDVFDLPAGSVHLASSGPTPIQAFRYGNSLGLQFHMEMTPGGLLDICERLSPSLRSGPYVQSREQLANPEHIPENHRMLTGILDRWAMG